VANKLFAADAIVANLVDQTANFTLVHSALLKI
jgi:hypothetical protein